ncbi:Putative prophage CPZ-55 integrase [Wohlfahrtiimonas chitiniclastica SH04]|uniref:Putative prophage CPZ-55 integrase n=1 Tax=Wohlfahrtiimonas chitiniclastica SH04 TaxID=1261130 RepID=L8Y0U1_9GAMM|nr:site-specific integrase [Wohlfahrtiimonas chitiniclastica]ELV08595.1 Putative prophage CPZ-55 integrase [Wohlfahrtiimonas chitiniclastica SH04]
MAQVKATTARGVSSLVKNGVIGHHAAGKGLYLQVNSVGSASWFYRYQVNGQRKKMGLGSYPDLTLEQAAIQASKAKELLLQGIDPRTQREKQRTQDKTEIITFDDVAADYIEAQRPSWTNEKHAQQWTNTLKAYASPVIGKKQPSNITTDDILKILHPIWRNKNETANRVRNRIEKILNAAKVKGLRTGENVATWRGHLEFLLPQVAKNEKHHAALPYDQINEFWSALDVDNSASTQALKLAILTATRTNEVLNAHWGEFDLNKRIWTIPAKRMKAKKEHRIPLSAAAIELLNQIPRLESGLLFEGTKAGKPLSNMAMLMKCRRMDKTKFESDGKGWRDFEGETITPHGFRSTFRDWAAETTSTPNMVVEQALAHTIGNAVEAAYRRGDLLERRAELMEAWASYVLNLNKD